MFNFSSIKKMLSDAGTEIRQLRQQIEAAQRQREDIITAPATREDVKTMVEKWAGGRSAEYIKRLQFNIQEFVTDPKNLQDAQVVDCRMTLFGKSRQMGALGMFPGPELDDMAVCFLMGTPLVKALHAAVDAMDWPLGSLPMEGRAKKISELDAKIAALVQQESSLVSAAAEAGVQIT